MEEDAGEGSVTKSVAMMACTAMALFYVAILYSPTWVLRLPPPSSFKQFMIRRFICAAISSLVSMLLSALILLPVCSLFLLLFIYLICEWNCSTFRCLIEWTLMALLAASQPTYLQMPIDTWTLFRRLF